MVTHKSARAAAVVQLGQVGAEHFGLHQPDWSSVHIALERPGLHSRVLAAALRLLSATVGLDNEGSIPLGDLGVRLRKTFLAEGRVVRWVRWYAFALLRHGRQGVPPNTELHRYLVRLDHYGSLLLTSRRPEGVAGLARLSLGLVHHLVNGTNLPA
ncbi:hypothetical protein ACFC26_17135 [Kitasatospora purpeofusca]|uniref:hypothetical protein n=1 Tax=Kitasatospora purpeofusca TaxID=67352 RepID=UPI0035D8DCE5